MEEGRNRGVEETGGIIDSTVDCEVVTIEMLKCSNGLCRVVFN
jgi:hypothetical protein